MPGEALLQCRDGLRVLPHAVARYRERVEEVVILRDLVASSLGLAQRPLINGGAQARLANHVPASFTEGVGVLGQGLRQAQGLLAYQLMEAGIGTERSEDLGAQHRLGEQRLYQAADVVAPEELNPAERLLPHRLGDRWVPEDGGRPLI